jgi:hypothetical protein
VVTVGVGVDDTSIGAAAVCGWNAVNISAVRWRSNSVSTSNERPPATTRPALLHPHDPSRWT